MKSIALMLLGSAAFTLNDAAMKLALTSLPYGQTLTIRGLVSCALLLAFAFFKVGIRAAVWNNARGQIEITCWYVGASFLFMYSLPHLDFPVAVTAVYTAPLFSVLLAWRFLGEKLRAVTVISTLLGFAGVTLAVGVESKVIHWIVILPILSGLLTAIRDSRIGGLLRSENSFSIILTHQVGLLLFGVVFALFEAGPAVPPPALSYWSAAGASIGGVLGVYFTVEAFRTSEIGSISAFRYSSILWAGLIGFMLWGNRFELLQIAGMVLVAVCGATIAIERHMQDKRARKDIRHVANNE